LIDIRKQEFAWPSELKPIGKDLDKEPFKVWWARNKEKLSQLHPQICEQWIYKYWDGTHYGFLPLENLTWQLEEWKTDRIIKSIGIYADGLITDKDFQYCKAEHDIKIFKMGYEPSITMERTGSWNIPILVLHSPSGFAIEKGPRPDVHYWLIEGHKRIRYLNALAHCGKPADSHLLYVLSLASSKQF
jgi:hypothetical protein